MSLPSSFPHRRDALGVHSVHAFAFSVPDLDEAARFYTAFGLDVRRRTGAQGDRLDLHTFGSEHRWGVLCQAPGPKQLLYVSFGCFAEDLDALAARADRLGVPRTTPHPLSVADGSADGLWLLHPDGFPVQVRVAPKSMPDVAAVGVPDDTNTLGRGRAPNRSRVAPVRPRRLAHILLFSPDVQRSVEFCEGVLGLRVSDRSGDLIAFIHGVHGSDHHLIATAKSPGCGLHHLSWDVASVNEVGLGMGQMQAAGHARGWGVGRHVLGSNYFYYVRDPWGSYSEYSYDIDYIAADQDWAMGDHPPGDSFYLWGPDAPEDFITNYELKEATP
ncbi:MAG: VOC family protein [Pseudomonadota bacterium]